jgi:hypothetical protein
MGFMRAVVFAVLIASSALLTPAANSQNGGPLPAKAHSSAQSPVLPSNESYKEAPTTECDTYAAECRRIYSGQRGID